LGTNPWEVLFDGVVEGELSFVDELHDHGGGEALGDAADAEAVGGDHRALRRQVVGSMSDPDRPRAVAGVDDNTGDASRDAASAAAAVIG